MKRWLVLSLGVALAAITLYAVATLRPAPPALDEIDEASRARLEQVLREEMDEAAGP